MWRSRLIWVFVVSGIVLTGVAAWYENEHQAHTSGYSSLVSVAFLVGIGLVEIVKLVRDSASSKGRLSGQTFLEEYTALLTNAIEALQDVHTYNEQQIHQTQTKILKLIASVVILFHPETEGLGISANLMRNDPVEPHSVQNRFSDYVYFSDPQRAADTYSSVLYIVAWSDPPQVAPANFSVPVDKDPRRVLFGAPATFVSGRKLVVQNIHDKKEVGKLLAGQPDDVQDAIHAFFIQQKYKTFMSLVVENADTNIAVLNVQADQLKVFGNQDQQTEIERFIAPFCSILGIITAQSSQSHPAPGPG